MKKLLVALALLCSFAAAADIPAVQVLPPQGPNGDPCFTSGVAKQSASINVTTATTTQVVATPGATGLIYVCGFALQTTGATTATTWQLEYGTGASCTSPTTLTPPLGDNATTTPTFFVLATGGTSLIAPAGATLCIVSAGTTIAVKGFVTYVTRSP